MNAEDTFLREIAQFELDAELELRDWARTAGMSPEELRAVLRAAIAGPQLAKAS